MVDEPKASPRKLFLGYRLISADGKELATYDYVVLFLRDPDPEVIRAIEKAQEITLKRVDKLPEEENNNGRTYLDERLSQVP